jgi:hypothetical protein
VKAEISHRHRLHLLCAYFTCLRQRAFQ